MSRELPLIEVRSIKPALRRLDNAFYSMDSAHASSSGGGKSRGTRGDVQGRNTQSMRRM